MKYLIVICALCILSAGPASASPAVPGDYDGDGKADILVTRSTLANNTHKLWLARFSSGAPHTPVIFGLSTDKEITGDFDGDGTFDLGLIREVPAGELTLLLWLTVDGTGNIIERQWGLKDDFVTTAYTDSDNIADLVAVRKIAGGLTWLINQSTGLPPVIFNWGLQNDTPFVADMTGNGASDAVVVRDNEIPGFKSWFVRTADGNGRLGVIHGFASDTALPPADFDGDGIADLIVSRTVGDFTRIFVRLSNSDGSEKESFDFPFGMNGDVLLPGNQFDSRRANILAFRRGNPNAQAFTFLTLPGAPTLFDASVPFGLSTDTIISPQGFPIAPPPAPEPEAQSETGGRGCVATPGTKTAFRGEGDLWKPVAESAPGNAVILLPRRYVGASVDVFGKDGNRVAGTQRESCCPNDNRMHFFLDQRASALSRFAPLTVRVRRGNTTECRVVPNPRQRYE